MSPSFSFGKAAAAFLFASFCSANPIEPRSIDASTFANLQLFEQFAAAAYCPGNFNATAGGTKLTCPLSNNCPLVEADDVTTVYEFQNSLLTDVTGYIALDHTRSLTVLAFRGSETLRNYLTDADFPTIPTPSICPLCTTDQGFYTSWLEARPGITTALASTTASHPTYRPVIVGHSLGGAIAAIAAAELRNAGALADLYTYGAPRIGGTVVSGYITNQGKGGNFRVTHFDDPVPKLPPLALGFVHISPEYYIRTGNGVVVGAGDVAVLEGEVNFGGNTGNYVMGGSDIAAHGWYFNNISACNPKGGLEF